MTKTPAATFQGQTIPSVLRVEFAQRDSTVQPETGHAVIQYVNLFTDAMQPKVEFAGYSEGVLHVSAPGAAEKWFEIEMSATIRAVFWQKRSNEWWYQFITARLVEEG